MSHLQKLLLAQTGYSAWATRQLVQACTSLTAAQLASEHASSHASILRTFCHMHDGERVWLARLNEIGEWHLPQEPASDHSFENVVKSWPQLWTGYREWIDSASDADLTAEFPTIVPNGNALCVPQWQIILHAVNHSTLHRGQIVTMLRALGQTPPNTDITEFCLTS
jgi:uncharacterized damage-inducible protein DinB